MRKKSFLLIIIILLAVGVTRAFADDWNELTNPYDVPAQDLVNDLAKVAIGVTIVGGAVLVAGRRGSDFTADFQVEDATADKTGSITVNFSGGVGPYTVTSVNPSGNYSISNSGDASTISKLKAGDYEITFQDSNGDKFTAKAKVGGEELDSAGGGVDPL